MLWQQSQQPNPGLGTAGMSLPWQPWACLPRRVGGVSLGTKQAWRPGTVDMKVGVSPAPRLNTPSLPVVSVCISRSSGAEGPPPTKPTRAYPPPPHGLASCSHPGCGESGVSQQTVGHLAVQADLREKILEPQPQWSSDHPASASGWWRGPAEPWGPGAAQTPGPESPKLLCGYAQTGVPHGADQQPFPSSLPPCPR